ncbi:MAG: DUF2240 family protein [Methanomassiliicoccales archaeon]|nr:MAG: DUF2240 family protein [Methanomassiliicoccales archaeon]
MEQLMQALGYLFQRKGTDVLSEKELILSASMDMGWFSPDEAKQLIEVGLELKLLYKTEGGLKPTFDYKSLEIPIDLTPKKNILQLESQEPLLLSIVRNIDEKTGLERNEIMAEINKKQDALNVEIEVAAILIAQKYELDISGFLREAESEIYKRAEKIKR